MLKEKKSLFWAKVEGKEDKKPEKMYSYQAYETSTTLDTHIYTDAQAKRQEKLIPRFTPAGQCY
jgi:hypothetical protein